MLAIFHCCRTRPLPKGFYEVTVCLVISVNEVLQVTRQPTQKLFISNGFELTWGVLFFGVVPVRPLDRCKFVFDALHNLSRVNNDNIVPFKIINVASMEREEKGTQLVFLCVLVTEINDTLVCREESTYTIFFCELCTVPDIAFFPKTVIFHQKNWIKILVTIFPPKKCLHTTARPKSCFFP